MTRHAASRFLAAISILGASLPAALAEASLPFANIPAPGARPQAAIDANIDRSSATGSAPERDPLANGGAVAEPDGIAALKSGLDALAKRDLIAARAARDQLPASSVDRHILSWAIALSGDHEVSSREIAAAALELPGWPGMAALRRHGERAMLRENPAPRAVIRAFGATPPQTIDGAIILARAHLALGDEAAARAAIVPLWRQQKLDASDEIAILREFGQVIPAADHRIRMERMLYADRVNSAERVAGLAGAKDLARAWGAVIRGDKAAGTLLEAVPKAERSAGYLYAKSKYLRRAKKFTQAAAVMLSAPSDRAALVDPDAWWVERRVLSRELLDAGDVKTAYKLAAAHAAESPALAADAEFHAGWYALRGLNDAKAAAKHFARIADIADGPISRGRAHYWLGRAAEAGGPGDANAHYAQAAANGSAFYGQIAAAKLGRDVIPASYPSPTAEDRLSFERREAVLAIRRLEAAGHSSRADILYRDLAAEIGNPGELALLAAMAEKRGNHYLALRVGKIAASRGLDVGALAHPTGAIPASAKVAGAGEALAYAIARQESEFNVGAVSGAGARGLLQLMPGTAKAMAKKAGVAYSVSKLTSDAGYNATLGAAFLSEQLGRFSGSYVLTFAGYNAGPRRAETWIDRYGDPRGKDLDTVVDWIERIPFTETRNYVQRVMENYQVYKMRLSGKMDIARDLVDGR